MQNKVEICGVNTSKLKVLKSEETQALLVRVKEGDMQAREELIAGNLRLVLSVIQRFSNRGENADDLFQVGCIGLIKAIDNFDINLQVKFSTYGVPMNLHSREEFRRYGSMKRKTALKQAISIVKSSGIEVDIKEEIIKKLELCISELPFAKWSEEAIFDACDQFIEDHKRPLILNDFLSKELPSHPTVANRFGMTLKEFRDKYYPLPEPGYVAPSEALDVVEAFREEFIRCGARTREDYDNMRDKNAPCSATVLKKIGTRSWHELLHHAKVEPPRKKRKSSVEKSSFHFKYEDELKSWEERRRSRTTT